MEGYCCHFLAPKLLQGTKIACFTTERQCLILKLVYSKSVRSNIVLFVHNLVI